MAITSRCSGSNHPNAGLGRKSSHACMSRVWEEGPIPWVGCVRVFVGCPPNKLISLYIYIFPSIHTYIYFLINPRLLGFVVWKIECVFVCPSINQKKKPNTSIFCA
jgi:hypothetical protein